MAGINSSIYGSIVSGNTGIGGMISGLDTESLVEQLTAGTRGKIAAQGQKKQLLQWQQTAYRGIIGTLTSFQNNFLSTKSASSPGNTDFFKQWKAAISGVDDGTISLVSSSTSNGGTVDLIKGSKATYATYTAGKNNPLDKTEVSQYKRYMLADIMDPTDPGFAAYLASFRGGGAANPAG